MAMARVARLVFAGRDPKGGAVLHGPRFFEQPTCHHRPTVTQTEPHAVEAGEILKEFFPRAPKLEPAGGESGKAQDQHFARRDQADARADQHVAEKMRRQQCARRTPGNRRCRTRAATTSATRR